MTNEEAKFVLEKNMSAYDIRLNCAYDVAIEALENAEKYKWHDLRQNPNDIPNTKRQVYVACEWGEYSTDFYPFADGVLAWREIEPFEVGE